MNAVFKSHQTYIVSQSHLILRSYQHWLHCDLLQMSQDIVQNAKSLFNAPFVVLSSGPDPDAILNYGNKTALNLWEMEWDVLCRTPSRQTAETEHRDTRAIFMKQVRTNGYIENYEGIRISSRGKRFKIEGATVWNLVDEQGLYKGQAATFPRWAFCK